MPNFKVLALIALALLAGFAIGSTLRSPAAPPTPAPTPAIPGYVEIQPGGHLPIPLETPPPGLAVPISPTLRVRLDIRDKATGQPVRADVVISVAGEPDRMVAQATSLVEFEVPQLDAVIIKVTAKGYHPWLIGVRGKAKYDRVVPLAVPLERVVNEDSG